MEPTSRTILRPLHNNDCIDSNALFQVLFRNSDSNESLRGRSSFAAKTMVSVFTVFVRSVRNRRFFCPLYLPMPSFYYVSEST